MSIISVLLSIAVLVEVIIQVYKELNKRKFLKLEGKYQNKTRTIDVKYSYFYNEGYLLDQGIYFTFSKPSELYEYLKDNHFNKV